MAPEEALQFFKDDMPLRISGYEFTCDAYETAIEALEKQIPKKITATYAGFMCPSCRTIYCYTHYDDDYCYSCGQRLLWEDNE